MIRLTLTEEQVYKIIRALGLYTDTLDWIDHEQEIKETIIPLLQYLEGKTSE